MSFRPIKFITAAFIFGWPLAVSAETAHVRAKLLADVKSVQPGTPLTLGIKLEMDPGWHTYWVNPGEAGLATRARWKLPQGMDVGPLIWPSPKKIDAGGVVSYGYEGSVLLMAQATTSSDLSVFEPVPMKVRVDWMECADVCVPGGADLTLQLPVNIQPPAVDESAREEFAKARAALPAKESSWRVSLVDNPTEWRLMFRPPAGAQCLDKKVSFYPDRPGLVSPSALQKWEWLGDGCRLSMKKLTLTDKPEKFSGLAIRADGWDEAGSQRALQVDLPIK